MVGTEMFVAAALKAGDAVTGDVVDSVREGTFAVETTQIMVLGAPVLHMCQEVETQSGAKCVVSNNALVYIDDPSRGWLGARNVQSIGIFRIAVLIDGVLFYEPAVSRPFARVDVAQLYIPSGAVIAGREANKRVLFSLPR
jgi:hypothetical protein